MTTAKCALLAYTFITLHPDPRDPEGPRGYLDHVWNAYGSLGMTEPFMPGLPVELPPTPREYARRFEIVAARGRPNAQAVYQTIGFVRHDTFGSVASLAPNRTEDTLETWADLYGEWTKAIGEVDLPSSVLGETLVFSAHAPAGVRPAEFTERFGRPVWQALRSVGLDVWDAVFLTADGFALWEGVEPRGRRVVAVVAPATAEQELDRWMWWHNERELAPFGGYLLNASKLHYESDAYFERRARLLEAMHGLDRPLAAVLHEHARFASEGRISVDRLVDAQADLLNAQQRETGLIDAASHLRELRRTVSIAGRNMMLALPRPLDGWEDPGDSLFARDTRLGGWLEEQSEMDLGYAEAVLERAHGAQNLTSLRLEQATAAHQRFQDHILLVQTITFGILIGTLTMVSFLGLEGPHRRSLWVPMIATVAASLLAAPLLVAHWPQRYGWLDRGSAILLGAAMLWCAVAAWPAASWWAALAAIPGAIIAGALLWRHDRRSPGMELGD